MKLHIYKTNRKIEISPYLTACKEQDGLLGNIEMNHYTNVEDIVEDSAYYVCPSQNVKKLRPGCSVWTWHAIADELNKPGVFDKLARFIRGKK